MTDCADEGIAMDRRLKLVITVDVEEEGLFSGRYPRTPPGVRSVSELGRVEFITREFGFPLTLLVTYPVATHSHSRRLLSRWRRDLGAEIGTHLHPWNTPPFVDLPHAEPVPSDLIPRALLQEKLHTLNRAIQNHLSTQPRSFRMGRFDLGARIRRLLPLYGLQVDSSIVPLRRVSKGPDHFAMPTEPFRWDEIEKGTAPLLEVPLTQVALHAGLARFLDKGSRRAGVRGRDLLLSWFRHVGVVGIQPAWFPLRSMQWAAWLHHRRGGRVLTMFFHSTELLPGATPDFPSEVAVGRLTMKIHAFLTWLVTRYSVEGVTLSDLLECAGGVRHPRLAACSSQLEVQDKVT